MGAPRPDQWGVERGGLIRKIASTGVASLVAALALLAGPASPAASAGDCRWSDKLPRELRLGQARSSVICLLNKERKSHGLRRLDDTKKLRRAAQKHTDVMQQRNCFAHQCPGEPDLAQRLRSVGYLIGGLLRWSYAENIGWGERKSGTPRSMVRAWMKSSGHRANILNGSLRDIGVGFVKGSPYSKRSNAGTYTTDFGLRIR